MKIIALVRTALLSAALVLIAGNAYAEDHISDVNRARDPDLCTRNGDYLTKTKTQVEIAVLWQCGFLGPEWSTDMTVQTRWCVGVGGDAAALSAEKAKRDAAIKKCEAERPPTKERAATAPPSKVIGSGMLENDQANSGQGPSATGAPGALGGASGGGGSLRGSTYSAPR